MFIHEKAICDSNEVGNGTRIWPFTHVMAGSKIGENCNLGEHCFIEQGAIIGNRVTVKNGVSIWEKVKIEDDVFIGPNVVFTNDLVPRSFIKKESNELLETRIKTGATIGANATIVCGHIIGEFSFIGAGSVVTRDVKDFEIVFGNPVKSKGWICECGQKLDLSQNTEANCECGKVYQLEGNILSKKNS